MNPTETPTQAPPAPPTSTEPPQPAPTPPAASPAPAPNPDTAVPTGQPPIAPVTPGPATASSGKNKVMLYAIIGIVVIAIIAYFLVK